VPLANFTSENENRCSCTGIPTLKSSSVLRWLTWCVRANAQSRRISHYAYKNFFLIPHLDYISHEISVLHSSLQLPRQQVCYPMTLKQPPPVQNLPSLPSEHLLGSSATKGIGGIGVRYDGDGVRRLGEVVAQMAREDKKGRQERGSLERVS